MVEFVDKGPTNQGGKGIQDISIKGINGEGMLVVIDPGVPGRDLFIERRLPGAALLLLDIERDAVEQITEALHHTSVPFASLHIVVTLAPGALRFVSGELSLITLKRSVEQLQTWFGQAPHTLNALDPKIFLYSPFTGLGNKAKSIGMELIDTLTWLTSAEIIEVAVQVEKSQWIPSNQIAGDRSGSNRFFADLSDNLAFLLD